MASAPIGASKSLCTIRSVNYRSRQLPTDSAEDPNNLTKRANRKGGHMAIWRRCSKRTCTNPRRCLEHLWFDVTYRGTRFRVAVNEFAIPRMDPNKQRPIASLEEVRDWERVFIGEIKAGRDPRRPRPVQKSSDTAPKDVADFLDAYIERCVKPAALKSVNSTCSRVRSEERRVGKEC